MNYNRATTDTRCKCSAALLNLRLDVHALSEDIVAWLADVHPVSWKFHLMNLSLASHDGEDFSLDRCGSILYAVNHVEAEQVESSVNFVAHKSLRLLDKAIDLTVLLSNDDTVACWVLDLGHNDSTLLAMASVVFNELLEWVFADHIGVEDKEET